MSDTPDWRNHFVEMVRGARPLDDDWFTGGPALSGMQQISVYKNQYRLRLYDAIAEEVPGLTHMLGEGADPLLRAYLFDHPSSTWTLNRVAAHLVGWLEERQVAAKFIEMARLDRAVQNGFEAAEGMPIEPAQLLTMPPLRLQPHVTLLRNTTSVHRVRSAVLSDGSTPTLVDGDFPLVVFRRGIKMRHWELSLGAWGVLDGFNQGLGPEAAINRVFEQGWADIQTLSTDVGTWFKDFSERNLVEIDSNG